MIKLIGKSSNVIIGCIISALLVVSFFLPRIWQNNVTVGSFNSVLIVCILCLCVHLVRKTSALFYSHVWNNVWFFVLWLIPVINLIVIAVQFIWGSQTFLQNPLISGLLVLISLPAFCCYFFSVLFFVFKKNKKLLISNIILDSFGAFYISFRLADRSFIPYIEALGVDIANFAEKLFSVSSYSSLVIYVLAFINFIICSASLRFTDVANNIKK